MVFDMQRPGCWLTFLALLLLDTTGLGAARTEVSLVFAAESARAGETVWAGIQLRIPKGWHTFWRNPGEAGSPTTVEWTLPDGVKAGEIQWPAPEKLVVSMAHHWPPVDWVFIVLETVFLESVEPTCPTTPSP